VSVDTWLQRWYDRGSGQAGVAARTRQVRV